MKAGFLHAILCAVTIACTCLPSDLYAETIGAQFTCGGHKTIGAAFHNGERSDVRLSLSDGRHLVLPQAPSASGARYANADESIVFWNKGNTAFIEEDGRTTYQDCVVKR